MCCFLKANELSQLIKASIWSKSGAYTPTLQKPEGFRVKAPEGEVVVIYFEPSATQNLKSSGFPEAETTWQNRPHPSNSPMEVSKNLSFCYDICNNCEPLSNLCHVVYATKGYTQYVSILNRIATQPLGLRCIFEIASSLPLLTSQAQPRNGRPYPNSNLHLSNAK